MTTPKWQAGHLYLKGDLVQPVQAVGGDAVAIPNSGFESGDTAWTKGAGWVVTNAVSAYAGSYTGEFQGAFAGPSVISMATAAACSPGQSITAKVKVNTGGNGVNDAGAAIRLTWYTAADAVIRVDEGNICRGGGNAWFESGVTATAPSGAAKVAVGVNAYRNDGSDALWIDAFTWNHVTPSAQEGLIYKAVQDDPGHSDSVEPAWPIVLGVQVVDNEVIWEAVLASRVTYEARPILKSGATEPTWPTTPGAFVVDGTISWECVSRRIEDENCPNTKVVHILAGKVFAADGDIIRFCGTGNPLDWTTPEDAGYLPSGLQSANANDMAVLHQYRGNLAAFNASSFQNWQADPNPAAMAILDQIDGIGSTWPKAAQAVANDLLFLSQRGVRSVGIAAGAENLSAGDVGIPIDALVQEALRVANANSSKVLSTHYPGAGQYWLTFADYPPPALSISGALPDGIQGDAVSYEYTVSGGVRPYASVVVSVGTLPAGLSLDTSDLGDGIVRVTGTRTTVGVYPFTLLATDADGNTATLADSSETTSAEIFFWREESGPSAQHCYSVHVSDDIIAIGHDNNALSYSLDRGYNWTIIQPLDVVNPVAGLVKYDGDWYAFGQVSGAAKAIGDSFDFAPLTIPFTPTYAYQGAFVIGDYLYAGENSGTTYKMRRFDGTNWTAIDTGVAVAAANSTIASHCQSGDWHLFGTSDGCVIRTNDFATFAKVLDLSVGGGKADVAELNGKVVACGNNGTTCESTDDGATFSAGYAGFRLVSANNLHFIGGDGGGNVSTSTTGATGSWTSRLAPGPRNQTVLHNDADLAVIGTISGLAQVGDVA